MAQDVFISYASEDKEAADKVCRALEAQGVTCWIAPRDVPYGADYEEAIMDGITTSRLLVLVLSPDSNASPHVKREIQNASVEGSGIEIIPFRIKDVAYNKALRYYLGSAQWLDASTPPLEQHLQPLVEHVRARLRGPAGTLPSHPTEVAPPPKSPVDPQPTSPRRRPLPLALIAAGAGVLLLAVVATVWVATRPSGGGNATNNSYNSNLATPSVTPNANSQGTGNTQRQTPTPTPTATPARTPVRVFPINANIRRPLNRNR